MRIERSVRFGELGTAHFLEALVWYQASDAAQLGELCESRLRHFNTDAG